jgi:hypothetical protein
MFQLHFYLFKDVSTNIWVELMFRFLGKDKTNQLTAWKQFMTLDSTKALLVFDHKDTEIGLGDHSKTVFFNLDNASNISELNPIIMDLSGNWILAEIRDLQESFKEFLRIKWELDSVEALIKM